MKFGDDILRQKALQENNKNIWWHHYYEAFMTSSCILGFVRLKTVENPHFFVFNPIYLKFGLGGNFEMLITINSPKLRLDNNLSRKMQFSTDIIQNFAKHPSTIALPWQQWMFHGAGL